MHAREIESALKTVVQRLKSKEAANTQSSMEQVLLDYGDEKNLAPAQLEKLAQTLNLTLTLAHTKQAKPEERGNSFDLVDTTKLLHHFTDPDRAESKRAAVAKGLPEDSWWKKFQAEAAAKAKLPNKMVDLPDKAKLTSTKLASEVVVKPEWQSFTVGDHFRDTPAKTPQWVDMEKVVDDPNRTAGWHKQAAELRIPTTEADAVTEMANAAWSRVQAGLTKLANKIRNNHAAYPEIVQDMLAYHKQAAVLIPCLDRHLDAQQLPRTKVAQDTRAFVRDRHSIAELAGDMLDAFEERQACLAIRDEILGVKSAVLVGEGPPVVTKKTVKKDEDKEKKNKQNGSSSPYDTVYYGDAAVPREASPGTTVPESLRDVLFRAGGAAQRGISEVSSAGRGLADVASSALPTAQDQAARMSDGYSALFGDGHRTQHQRLTGKLENWQHAAVLQRLLMSDEVLSKMNPRDVIASFQTLRANSPHVARDINVTRGLLREALQYHGVPLQQVKTLRDIEGKTKTPETADNSTRA